jgi:hypothetical protein
MVCVDVADPGHRIVGLLRQCSDGVAWPVVDVPLWEPSGNWGQGRGHGLVRQTYCSCLAFSGDRRKSSVVRPDRPSLLLHTSRRVA